jgi:hypothetical protein
MKQLLSLFLFLLPCLALAQYPSNGNQKITLGEQTTADGLIYRGVAADTTLTAKSDTAAYFVLDTVNKKLYFYKVSATPKWNEISGSGGSTLDTATMLLPYYRSGKTGIIQALDVPTLNQNTTGSAATLTTSRTFQTNLASTSTASFNGSANVTPGVTGTLPVANGGTGSATQNFVDLTNTQTVGGAKTFSSSIAATSATFSGNIALGTTPANAAAGAVIRLPFDNAIRWRNSTNTGDIGLYVGGLSDLFQFDIGINVAGAATFSSSVTATTGTFSSVGAGAFSNNLNITSNGTLTTATSDEKFKYNINPIKYGLSTILQLNPVNFQWIKGEENDLGFIAQDVAEIIPEAVDTNWNSDLLMRYESIIPVLTKAIQEQQALIKALEQRIINLENK